MLQICSKWNIVLHILQQLFDGRSMKRRFLVREFTGQKGCGMLSPTCCWRVGIITNLHTTISVVLPLQQAHNDCLGVLRCLFFQLWQACWRKHMAVFMSQANHTIVRNHNYWLNYQIYKIFDLSSTCRRYGVKKSVCMWTHQ